MNKDITEGNAVIGRVGLSSASTKVANFLFDNVHFQGQVGQSEESTTTQPPATTTPSTEGSSSSKQTPSELPGAETMSYRKGENEMNLFVFRHSAKVCSHCEMGGSQWYGGHCSGLSHQRPF